MPGATAQDATPAASAFDDLGLPRLDVTVTADAYEGIPESLEAGRYLVTVTVAEGASDFGGGIAFMQPPKEMTADEFMAAFMSPPDESGVGAANSSPDRRPTHHVVPDCGPRLDGGPRLPALGYGLRLISGAPLTAVEFISTQNAGQDQRRRYQWLHQ